MLEALAYTFEPLTAVKRQRHQWIQSSVQSSFISFFKLGPHWLPVELALMVARYCTRVYAIAAVCLPIARPRTDFINILDGIWVSYIMIDGVRYLASLTNEPSANARLLLRGEVAADVDRMYVAEDHLGIRQVYFGNGNPPHPASGLLGVWWRTLSLHSGARLRVHNDVGITAPGLDIYYTDVVD